MADSLDFSAAPLSELTLVEDRTALELRTGLLTPGQAAERMYHLANAYFTRSDFRRAKEVAAEGNDLSPESLAGVKCQLIVGNLTMIESDGFRRAAVVFAEADQRLETLIKQQPSDNVFYERAVILNRMAHCYDMSGQTAKAIEAHDTLLKSPDLVRCGGPERVVAALGALGRFHSASGDLTTARKYYDQLEEAVGADSLPADRVLAHLFARVQRLWPNLDSPERITALEELWTSSRFRELPGILEVGDDLLTHYFFQVPMEGTQYDRVAAEQLKRIHELQTREKAGERISWPSRFDAIYATCLITNADRWNSRLKRDQAKLCVQEFSKAFEARELKLTIPAYRPVEQLDQLRRLYERTMTEHVESLARLKEKI